MQVTRRRCHCLSAQTSVAQNSSRVLIEEKKLEGVIKNLICSILSPALILFVWQPKSATTANQSIKFFFPQ